MSIDFYQTITCDDCGLSQTLAEDKKILKDTIPDGWINIFTTKIKTFHPSFLEYGDYENYCLCPACAQSKLKALTGAAA